MLQALRDGLRRLLSAPELRLAPGERTREVAQGERGRVGLAAEEAAAALLRRQGCRILCRNRVNRLGELDIVAQDGDRVVFVEVRARADDSPVPAKDTLTRRKRETLARTVELFIRQHRLHKRPQRVDLVAVTHARDGTILRVEHYPGLDLSRPR